MPITPLSPDSYRRFPWKNGGGVTVDIAVERLEGLAQSDWDGLVWRLGRTTISQPGPFSDLSGYDRCQVVIAGAGLVLEAAHGEIDLRQPFNPVRYPGEWPLTSRLESGAVEVVNLIGDRTRVAIDLVVLRAGESLQLAPGSHVVHAPIAAASLLLAPEPARESAHEVALAPDHAIRIEPMQVTGLRCETGICLVASILPAGPSAAP